MPATTTYRGPAWSARRRRPLLGGSRADRLTQLITVLLGISVAVIAGWDGSAGWRAGRVLLIGLLTALAATAQGSTIRWQRGLAALVAGLAGTCAGIGIGVMHAVKTGLSVIAFCGLISLAAGLVLTGIGAVILTRTAHGWWRLLAIPAAFAAVEFVIIPLSVAVYATNVPATTLGTATPASHGLSYRQVTFRTADHLLLSGWYIPSRNGAAVVLAHGSGSTRSDVLAQAVVLARHGFGVLLFDARGHGLSGGHAMDFGWYGNLDVSAAVSYLEHRHDVHSGKIAVVGESMGGEEVIGAAAADYRIRAVVAEGATGRSALDSGWKTGTLANWIDRIMSWETTGTASLLTGGRPPVSLPAAVVLAAPTPVLLIAAGQVPDEAAAGRWIQRAAPHSVRLWIAPGSGHTGGLATDRRAWTSHVIRFLERALHVSGA